MSDLKGKVHKLIFDEEGKTEVIACENGCKYQVFQIEDDKYTIMLYKETSESKEPVKMGPVVGEVVGTMIDLIEKMD